MKNFPNSSLDEVRSIRKEGHTLLEEAAAFSQLHTICFLSKWGIGQEIRKELKVLLSNIDTHTQRVETLDRTSLFVPPSVNKNKVLERIDTTVGYLRGYVTSLHLFLEFPDEDWGDEDDNDDNGDDSTPRPQRPSSPSVKQKVGPNVAV